jgi:hypothetical protein
VIAPARPVRFPLALAALLALASLAALASSNAPSLAPLSDGGDKAAQSAYGKLPLSFVPNKGQVDARARFYAQAPGLGVFFGDDKVTLALQKERKGHALELRFPGANPDAVPEALDRRAGKVNYMTGSDRSKWQTDIPTYGAIRYRSLWPGIDLTFKGRPGALKYELTVHPGADPSDVRLAYAGASGLSVTDAGALNVATTLGALVDQRPKTFQRGGDGTTPVESSYALHGANAYGFSLGPYDHSRALVIDPGLVYSTFIGGSDQDKAYDVALDAGGAAYVTGSAAVGFPTTAGAYDTTLEGLRDVFVTKLNAAGSALVYSTFLGGTAPDTGWGLAVDSQGRAYVTGEAVSTDFPTTSGAFDGSYNGGFSDGFVAKLNPAGSGLVYSTLLGGATRDSGFEIALDAMDNAYVEGWTNSSAFPTTAGAFDTTFNGGSFDVFVTKLNAAGSGLAFSSFLGGVGEDQGDGGIAVDGQQDVYVTGDTDSIGYPTTPGAFDTTINGAKDAFVTKLSSTGSSLVYSTFLGGPSYDFAEGVALDDDLNAYTTGSTQAAGFPTTAGAYDATFNGGSGDAFVTKLNGSGSGLLYSTLVGGEAFDFGHDIRVDSRGSAYVAGGSDSVGFPTTPGAIDSSFNGGARDAILVKLNPPGSGLVYSTYLGGDQEEWAYGLQIDNRGNAYLAGFTRSDNFPTTPAAYDRVHDNPSGDDAFVAKLGLPPSYDAPASASPLQFSLVPELRQTISASQCQARGGIVSSHGPPLSFTSCNPPAFVPGTAARFRGTGNASLTVVEGNLATPADEADVAVVASLTDVRAAAGGDYAPDPTNPDLTLVARLRISDTHNGAGLSDPGTVADLEFPTPVNCATTPDPATGSICAVSTTADAVNAGSILEGRSAVLQTFRVRVNDSGPNGVRGDSDDRRLASQGIYIP